MLGQRQRRRPRLDPAKIDVNHVTGDENVSVVHRATGKRITGAKAPPIRYLKEWLLRNPEYDVDPKWGHIVKAKACIVVDIYEIAVDNIRVVKVLRLMLYSINPLIDN